eukprot:4628831-Pyramimonas_sp.AAC.1
MAFSGADEGLTADGLGGGVALAGLAARAAAETAAVTTVSTRSRTSAPAPAELGVAWGLCRRHGTEERHDMDVHYLARTDTPCR